MINRVDPELRAAACERLRAVAETEGLVGLSAEPEPSFPGLLRHLYENSALPVREIAHIAGIIERTLYKYAQTGGWKRRNWRQARYDGARLVPAGEAGFPDIGGPEVPAPEAAQQTAARYIQVRRLVDEAGAAAAAAAKEREKAARKRAARGESDALTEARLAAFAELNRTLADLRRLEETGGKDSLAAQRTTQLVHTLLGRIERLQVRHGD